jgi:glycosyltransferase involved in cell wall biosynthesis
MFEASRMDSTKRKDVLLKAFARALENMDQNCLLFIGGGPENDEFKSLQEILNSTPALKGKAFLLGFIPDEFLPKLFGFCDIYLTASEMEGFGMSVAQAAMAAKPIISSDMIPFTNFFISDEAIIAPAGDVEAFASGIKYFVGHAEERKIRGMKAKVKALDMEWKTLAKSFIFDLNKIKFNITIPEN